VLDVLDCIVASPPEPRRRDGREIETLPLEYDCTSGTD